jgi:penicillin-binding protein 1A
MTSIMQDVARIGTAAKARELALTTWQAKPAGTSNNLVDAWFADKQPGTGRRSMDWL